MAGRHGRLGFLRFLAAVAGAALVALAWWQVVTVDADLTRVAEERDGVPMALLIPDEDQPVPGVVVVHGFAGSRQLMTSFGLALARSGYAVALPDLSGHGANPASLGAVGEGGAPRDDDLLVDDVLAALAVLAERPEVDGDRLALVGHSMGSGAVLRAGLGEPAGVRAVVAVSPTDAEVTVTSPPDLLLLAGAREPRFVATAERLLERAGGPGGAPGDGDARALAVVPHVEHVGILFSPTAHGETVAWLDGALEPAPVAAHGADRHAPVLVMGWWALHLAGLLIVWRALAPALLPPRVDAQPVPAVRVVVGLLGGGAAATVVLAVLVEVAPIGALGGLLVAPALAVWFGLAGIAWLAAGATPGRPRGSDVRAAAVVLLVLVAAFGALAPWVWLPWFPIPARILAGVLMGLLVLPWTLAWASALAGRHGARAVGWWAIVSGGLLLGVGAAALLVRGLGFVMFLLPLLPWVMALAHAVWAPARRPWAAGLASAAFLGWLFAVIFPLA